MASLKLLRYKIGGSEAISMLIMMGGVSACSHRRIAALAKSASTYVAILCIGGPNSRNAASSARWALSDKRGITRSVERAALAGKRNKLAAYVGDDIITLKSSVVIIEHRGAKAENGAGLARINNVRPGDSIIAVKSTPESAHRPGY